MTYLTNLKSLKNSRYIILMDLKIFVKSIKN
jgi:hypothetical protein